MLLGAAAIKPVSATAPMPAPAPPKPTKFRFIEPDRATYGVVDIYAGLDCEEVRFKSSKKYPIGEVIHFDIRFGDDRLVDGHFTVVRIDLEVHSNGFPWRIVARRDWTPEERALMPDWR